MPKKKHSPYSPRATFFLTLSVVALITALGFLPPMEDLRTVDLFVHLKQELPTKADEALESDDLLARFDDSYQAPEEQKPEVVTPVVERTKPSVNKSQKVDSTRGATEAPVQNAPAPSKVVGKDVTPIEDFSPSGTELASFLDKLQGARNQSRPVRIAVVGDSFIEGDIFTQDLRELLQTRFGGRGVGFVPITSQVAGFRQTVGHSFSGWSTSSIVSKPNKGKYLLSSYLYTPSSDRSTVRYKGATVRRYLDSFSRARFLFVHKGKNAAKIEVQTNEGESQTFTAYPSSQLTQVVLVEDSIRSVSFSVVGADAGFVAYGAFLDEGRGVNVDNYSVRGNSGISMASIDGGLMQQLHEIQPIDMVIVQYGLNVVQSDVKAYTLYQTQMQRVVSHLKNTIPGVVILVLGIPDRTRRTGEGWVTMPGVEAMAKAQRALAQSTGVLYWSTLDAMRARGGMSKFVERGWAAKDYTHLSARGGREIGRALYDALMNELDNR